MAIKKEDLEIGKTYYGTGRISQKEFVVIEAKLLAINPKNVNLEITYPNETSNCFDVPIKSFLRTGFLTRKEAEDTLTKINK